MFLKYESNYDWFFNLENRGNIIELEIKELELEEKLRYYIF